MEFYEAWDLAEDEQLREDLQRTLKRSRSCSPTSPAGSEEQDLPAPDAEEAEAEDRASATTQPPSIVEEEKSNTGEKLSTPNGRAKMTPTRTGSLNKHVMCAEMTGIRKLGIATVTTVVMQR